MKEKGIHLGLTYSHPILSCSRSVAALPSIVVKCGGVVLRVVVCGVVLVLSCVVLFLLCVCVCDCFSCYRWASSSNIGEGG